MAESTLFILAGYLWGAFPTAYLVARRLRGVDIRTHGSGNVGASNLTEVAGWRFGLSIGVFDCLAKGTLPVVAAGLADQSLAVQAGVGLAAIAGHNWSPFIRFTGGRGVATGIGVYFGFFMWQELLVQAVVIWLVGRQLLKDSAFWTLVSLLLIPVLAYGVFDREPEVVLTSVAVVVLLVLKRLTANWTVPEGEFSWIRLLGYRFLWDRDVSRKDAWVEQQPRSADRAT